MYFTTDQQTLNDLMIFGKPGTESVFSIFDHTQTRGGSEKLEELFRYPMADYKKINSRSNLLKYFTDIKQSFPFRNDLFDTIEQYLANKDERSKLPARESGVGGKLRSLVSIDPQVKNIQSGVLAVYNTLKDIKTFSEQFSWDSHKDNPQLEEALRELRPIVTILEDNDIREVLGRKIDKSISYDDLATTDILLRFKKRDIIRTSLQGIYLLDAFLSVSKVADEKGYGYPVAEKKDRQEVVLEEVYHPHVKGAVPNSLKIDPGSNIVFLTGANMAGKSTLMKSIGIAIYLAHMGFPVAAKKMRFSVREGIYTSINLPDNLNRGISHFYAEVLRIKKVAHELGQGKNLFVIVDELFRGTNVKDAYEATVSITAAFAARQNCMFVVSTHIMEAGDTLKEMCTNINFVYLPTEMQGNKPVYPYKLKQGITDDRHGMVIVRNEKILELLAEGREKPYNGKFIADQQSLNDLNLMGKFKKNSVYSLFNKTKTRGGEKLLENIFKQPLEDAGSINERSAIIRHFDEKNYPFPFITEEVDTAEQYLLESPEANIVSTAFAVVRKKGAEALFKSESYKTITKGINATLSVLNGFATLMQQATATDNHAYQNTFQEIRRIISGPQVSNLLKRKTAGVIDREGIKPHELPLSKVIYNHHIISSTLRKDITRLLEILYELDVYIAISGTARANRMGYADAYPATENKLQARELRHPTLEKAVSNAIHLTQQENVLFLTGANMAGKSTWMKTIGSNMYLAHLGLPVAAAEFEFSVKEGIYSSINVPDDIFQGYSHFYAEVLRVKEVAERVSEGRSLLVLFDELFKGTNVKDAYDATLAVTAAFAQYRNCLFVISTHIIEVGRRLEEDCGNVQFKYLPTVMEGSVPKYTYRLTEGVTNDRQGMMIIKNEKILESIGGDEIEITDNKAISRFIEEIGVTQ